MTTFKRVLTALDLSEQDEKILAFSNDFFRLLKAETAYFIHIIPDFSVPKNIEAEFQQLFAPEFPIDERIKEDLGEKINEHFPKADSLATHIEVIEGEPYQKLLHWTEVKKIDLLMVGNKPQSEGSGITPKRVARKAKTSVCYVGAKSPEKVRRILVALDFSEPSKRALEMAMQMKKEEPSIEVIAMHLIPLPATAMEINKNYPKIKSLLFDAGKERAELMLAKMGYYDAVETVFEMNNSFDVALHLQHYARENNIDLIMIGAKGHSLFENFLYGSVTEKLVSREHELAVLVVR